MSIRTFAAIDVGSFELTMKIFEFSGKNNMREIDRIGRRLDLGSDTYATGKIGPEKMDELCRTLKEFAEIMHSYQVSEYRAYGTSAIRETENLAIIQDQIAQRTGISLEVLSNSEQRFLDYKAIASRGESFRRIIEEKTAILDMGGGSIQLSLFDNDTLVSTQNLRLGVLRTQETLHQLKAGSARLEGLVEEMAQAQLGTYKKLYLKDREIKNLIIIDDNLAAWAARRNGKDGAGEAVTNEELEELLAQLRGGWSPQTEKLLGIPEEKIPLMLIGAVLIRQIEQMMGAEKIWAPGVTLCDGMAYEYAEKIKMFREEHDFEKDIVACAMNISKRYMGSRKRAETLEKLTTTIFDSMKKIHGMGKRERLYLRLAAILQDCGKYISLVNIGENSYNIIMATEMIGLSHQEREIVANVVRFHHSSFIYFGQQENRLDRQAYLTVAKLTAILRLAGGLDRSHKQKLKGLKATLKDDSLILTVDTQEDITLERGYLEAKSVFFKEVFAVEPILKQRKAI